MRENGGKGTGKNSGKNCPELVGQGVFGGRLSY